MRETADGESKWVTVRETATATNSSRQTVYRLIKSGAIPARKFGGEWRIPRSFIEWDDAR